MSSVNSPVRLRILLLVATTAVITACGSSPSNVEPPAELKSYTRTVDTHASWSVSMGATAVPGARMKPALEGNRIVYADGKGGVRAIDSANGKTIWEANLDTRLSSGVAADSRIAVVATANGEMVALSLVDGNQVWSSSITGEVLSAPVIGGGKVIVQTTDGRVLALDENNGKQMWAFERTVPSLSLRGSSGPIFQQGLVVAGFASGHVVGIDSRNGRAIWERVVAYPTGRSDVERLVDVDAPPLIVGYYLFATSYQGKLAAIDLRNGQFAWSRPMSSYLSMAADARNLYVVNDQGAVMAIDQASGNNVWVQNELERRITSGLAVMGTMIVAGDYQGYIHLLRSSDGKIVGRYSMGSSPVISNQVEGDTLYSNTENGKIVALQVQSR